MTSFGQFIAQEQRDEFLVSRIGSLILQGYQIELDLEALKLNGRDEEAEALLSSLSLIKSAIEVCKKSLSADAE